jgi:hypothetical protein
MGEGVFDPSSLARCARFAGEGKGEGSVSATRTFEGAHEEDDASNKFF